MLSKSVNGSFFGLFNWLNVHWAKIEIHFVSFLRYVCFECFSFVKKYSFDLNFKFLRILRIFLKSFKPIQAQTLKKMDST